MLEEINCNLITIKVNQDIIIDKLKEKNAAPYIPNISTVNTAKSAITYFASDDKISNEKPKTTCSDSNYQGAICINPSAH